MTEACRRKRFCGHDLVGVGPRCGQHSRSLFFPKGFFFDKKVRTVVRF